MKTLALVSPKHMTGPDVKAAQAKLAKAGFLRDTGVDGEYGPETARAAAAAHWYLGFARALAHAQTYGDTLDRVLTGFIAGTPLPPAYLKRRDQRLAQRDVHQQALDWLRQHIGDTEHPAGSNCVDWASVWYLGYCNENTPWCAMGATRAHVEAGSKSFKRGEHYSYVPYIVADAIRGANGLFRTFIPAHMHLACFDWNGDGIFDHVETVDTPPATLTAGASFTTIGCNTSFDDGGDQSNGGACAHRTRSVLSGGRVVFVEVRT